MHLKIALNQPLQVVLAPSAPKLQLLQACAQGLPGGQGPAGPVGPDGDVSDYISKIPFAFGDASPRVVLNLPEAKTVLQVNINITQPFNGAGASFKLGTNASPELLVSSQQVDLAIACEFETNPNQSLSPTDIVLTINPGTGATQGAGWLVIERVDS